MAGWSDYVVEGTHKINTNPVRPGNIYRHFKGGVYQVVTIAIDEADRHRKLIIYRSIKDHSVWARESSIFESKVDAEKYPEFAGQDRMEFVGFLPLVM